MLHAAASAGAARAGQSARRGNSACAVIARNAIVAMTTTTMRHSVPLLGGGSGGVTVSASASAPASSSAGAASSSSASSLPSHHTLSTCARLAPVVRAAADLGDPYEYDSRGAGRIGGALLSVAAHSSSTRWARTDAGSGVCTTENEQVRRSLVNCCSHLAAVGQMHCVCSLAHKNTTTCLAKLTHRSSPHTTLGRR